VIAAEKQLIDHPGCAIAARRVILPSGSGACWRGIPSCASCPP